MSNLLEAPNTTHIPNAIFDYWMAILSPGEFKVLLAICRKTLGWRKVRDRISLRQIEVMTGLSKKGIVTILQTLVEYDLIVKLQSIDEYGRTDPNLYELQLPDEKEGGGGNSEGGMGVLSTQGGGVLSTPTKETIYTKENPPSPPEGGKARENAPEPKAEMYQVGKFVKLPKTEWLQLCETFGAKLMEEISEDMNDWIAQQPKNPYKDFGAAFRQWLKKRGIKKPIIDPGATEGLSGALEKVTSKQIAEKIENTYKKSSYAYVEACSEDVEFFHSGQNVSKRIEYSLPVHVFLQECNRYLLAMRAPFRVNEKGNIFLKE